MKASPECAARHIACRMVGMGAAWLQLAQHASTLVAGVLCYPGILSPLEATQLS